MCVFEETHALGLFLFGSRHWFLALFSMAILCKRLESYLEERKEFLTQSNEKCSKLQACIWLGWRQGRHVDSAVRWHT